MPGGGADPLGLPRFFLYGHLPVRAVRAADGGMLVEALSRETGRFEPNGWLVAELFLHPDTSTDVEELDGAAFERVVESLRARRVLILGADAAVRAALRAELGPRFDVREAADADEARAVLAGTGRLRALLVHVRGRLDAGVRPLLAAASPFSERIAVCEGTPDVDLADRRGWQVRVEHAFPIPWRPGEVRAPVDEVFDRLLPRARKVLSK